MNGSIQNIENKEQKRNKNKRLIKFSKLNAKFSSYHWKEKF